MTPRTAPATDPDLDRLLEKTSRTFALSIPLLPEPTRNQVTLSYLLFRIADTFEDAAVWPKERRIRALHDFADLLEDGDAPGGGRVEELASRWAEAMPSEHRGYLELLAATPMVLRRFDALDDAARRTVAHHTVRTCRGMARFVARSDERGNLELDDEADLVDYCYVVAGIVGELLTELFVLGRSGLADDRDYLHARAASFGEGLQLVNILKDSKDDAAEGRRFLPRGVDRGAVFRRARRDLAAASAYVLRLQEAQLERGVEVGLVAFTALPVRLARATLDKVERDGPGSKISRLTVYRLKSSLERALERGTPAVEPPAEAGNLPGSGAV